MAQARKPEDDGHHGGAGGRKKGPAFPTWFPLLVAAVLAGGAAVGLALMARSPLPASTSSGVAQIGGPFQMVDQQGRAVDQGVLTGKWSVVYFGYVSCPDVCPATLQVLSAVQAHLGADAARFRVVFVTVDPARDTPAQMKVYLDQPDFPPGTVGLTGTAAQVAAMARAYRVYYAKAPRQGAAHEGADYGMDHSSALYLMDPQGRFSRPLAEQAGPDALAGQIRDAMHGG